MKRICLYCLIVVLSLVIVVCTGDLSGVSGIAPSIASVVPIVPVSSKVVAASFFNQCDNNEFSVGFSGGNYDNVTIWYCGDFDESRKISSYDCSPEGEQSQLLGSISYRMKSFVIDDINLDKGILFSLIYSKTNLSANTIDLINVFEAFNAQNFSSCNSPVISTTLGG